MIDSVEFVGVYAGPRPLTRWAMRILAIIGLALGVFLTWVAYSHGPIPGCGVNSSFTCDAVLVSRWAKWLIFPVSLLASLVYLAMLLASFLIAPVNWERNRRRTAWAFSVLLAGSVMLFCAAVWFVFLLKVIMDESCPYCVATHSCGLALSLLGFGVSAKRSAAFQAKPAAVPDYLLEGDSPPKAPPSPRGVGGGRRSAVVGIVGVAALIVGQLVYVSPEVYVTAIAGRPDLDSGPGLDREITVLSRRARLRTHDHPILGSPDAKHVAVCLYDYTCPNCRPHHRGLQQAMKRYGDQLAIILLSVPRDMKCNSLITTAGASHEGACYRAEAGMGLWRVRPDLYADFDTWMYKIDGVRTDAEIREYIVDRIGEEAYTAAQEDPWIAREIEQSVGLYRKVIEITRDATIPKLIVGSAVVVGGDETPQELFDALEELIDLTPAAPAAEAATADTPE